MSAIVGPALIQIRMFPRVVGAGSVHQPASACADRPSALSGQEEARRESAGAERGTPTGEVSGRVRHVRPQARLHRRTCR